ncbi:transposase [Streptomyces sp. MMS24-I2-30]|uniref:IS110 family transposase n=1 Tax=Streptomyces sp. MMS24-I2-30 TaxID=3351564 RepID=UPI0038968C9B
MQTSEQPRSGHVVIGVDTHKHVHVAAVMDTIGGILATLTIPTDTGGFQQLSDWASSFGNVLAFGIEGTGSYGATLTSFLRRTGHKVVEAGRPDRRLRRMNGKPDTLDAENAARAVLAGFATATPKTADGEAGHCHVGKWRGRIFELIMVEGDCPWEARRRRTRGTGTRSRSSPTVCGCTSASRSASARSRS